MLDLDPASLREWLAAVGLLHLVTATTDEGRLLWRLQAGRYRLELRDVPTDLAARSAAWIATNRQAWAFADHANVKFDATTWRHHATKARGLEAVLWCAVAADAVAHRDGKKLQASVLEYGHGGGHQHWLASLRYFMSPAVTTEDHLARILAGDRNERMKGQICRWDPACERNHAYRAKAPDKDGMTQDQTLNALAAIGFASCPSAPTRRGLVTPLVYGRDTLRWPIWLEPLRLPDLEAALACDWSWPTMQSRRWLAGKFYCFAWGELREPEADPLRP